MPDELLFETGETNTPETIGAIPRYVLQYHAVSRSAHSLSATARKLTAMAMALLPADLASLSVSFTFAEFCVALGVPKGGETFIIFKTAVKECMKSVIEVDGPPNNKGKKPWVMFLWFQLAQFNPDTGVCSMTFDKKLAEFLKELKRLYAKINLIDFGRLQSRYALRIYEFAISYASMRGKDGNHDQDWYFERDIDELRKVLGVPDKAYHEMKRFRQKVIEEPVKEINKAGVGFEISTESVKQGRRLTAIRFNCKQTPRIAFKKKSGKKTAATALPEPSPKTAHLQEEKELERLMERYPEEFTALYEEELAKPSFLPADSSFRQTAAKYAALIRLREKYGIVT
jgi:plasmid replication initiation protein